MAILTEGRLLLTDASNVPLSGGKARIYNTGTTTLTSVFSDAGLTTPLTNPVVANSSGFTPVIYAAEATSVDVAYLTSADAAVAGRTYVAVPFLGSDTGSFSRVLSDNTRFSITGAGGIVLMRVGDPSPDNVGGQLTIEGWAGTQGDTLTLDFATTNTTGVITENSKKLIGIVNTAATTFTAVSTVEIALTQNPTGVLAHQVDIFNLIGSVSGIALRLRFSYDGGATYKAGGTDYAYTLTYNNQGDGLDSAQYLVDAAETYIQINNSMDFSTFPAWVSMTILTTASGTRPTIVQGTVTGLQSTLLAPALIPFQGYGFGSYGKATHVQVILAAGTISGAYRVAPLRGFGEA